MLALINDVTRVEAWEHVCVSWSHGLHWFVRCVRFVRPGPRRGSRLILCGEQFDEPHVLRPHCTSI